MIYAHARAPHEHTHSTISQQELETFRTNGSERSLLLHTNNMRQSFYVGDKSTQQPNIVTIINK